MTLKNIYIYKCILLSFPLNSLTAHWCPTSIQSFRDEQAVLVDCGRLNIYTDLCQINLPKPQVQVMLS